MNNPKSLTLKANIMALAPAFAFLAACGGGGDTAGTPSADVLAAESTLVEASRPADYMPDTSTAMIGDADAAVDSPAASVITPADASRPAEAFTDVDASSPAQPERLLAVTGSIVDSSTAVATDASAIATTDAVAAAVVRDPFKQPFATNSIWNMPIGSGAVYVAANLPSNPGNNIYAKMPGVDDEHIVLKPTAPMTAINVSKVAWSGGNRCGATGGLLVTVPIPRDYLVPNSTSNSSSAFLMPDRRTIVQTQPLARCTAGGPGTSLVKFASVDLYGPGITGAHGGSGMSAIGGSIRLGELRPGGTGPKHVLKLAVYAKEALYKCTSRANCFRWPAVTSDSYAVGFYGSANGNSNTAMKMGALLAIPPSKTIASLGLETEPARQLAWTLQNYGAYIVDDTYAAGFFLNAEVGADGSVMTQFKNDYGFDMEQRAINKTPWVRDMQRLSKALSVVNNNSASNIGGGGTPRQPLAPPIAP